MKLLIVDDEPHIVDWIYDLMCAEFPELIVLKAYSGVQAEHTLGREQIDILMTDIRMPKMTGIQLMELVRKRWPKCRILFLTGFGEFDYVYTAIQQKGVRYLLKTEDDAVIVRAVREMMDEVCQEENIYDRVDRLLRREYALHALIRGSHADNNILDAIGFHPEFPVWFFYVRIRNAEMTISGQTAEQIAVRTLTGCRNSVRSALQDGDAVWIAQSMEPLDRIVEAAENFCAELQAACGGATEVAIRSETAMPSEMGRILSDWINLCARRPFAGGVITSDSFGRHALPQRSKLENQRRMTLIESMEFMLARSEKERYMKSLYAVLDGLQESAYSKDLPCTQVYLAIMLQLTTHTERHSLKPVLEDGTCITSIYSPDSFYTWNEAFNYLRKAAQAVLDAEPQNKQMGMTYRLTEYIDSHLEDALSLTMLAELMHYNPSYLSRAFKQQMGMNLNAYILQARMRKACMLLAESNDKIADIAGKVGIRDARHFTRLFQRNVGVSPQAYRDARRK